MAAKKSATTSCAWPSPAGNPIRRSWGVERIEEREEGVLLQWSQGVELPYRLDSLTTVQVNRLFERLGSAVMQIRGGVSHTPQRRCTPFAGLRTFAGRGVRLLRRSPRSGKTRHF